ncbi:hypothetical protein E2C01_020893 [Portunus trituberculatus]|uniref:Uncharacterized protein n=1 Tax=Portunus trituberculatus TaxID=210409 RepID=A0A5B7E4N3_PORTR|nr:hypothetical protein [Portunus trituberculatus]
MQFTTKGDEKETAPPKITVKCVVQRESRGHTPSLWRCPVPWPATRGREELRGTLLVSVEI